MGYPSHALLSSILGAAVATAGTDVIIAKGVIKILLGLFFSPIVGFLLGMVVMWGDCLAISQPFSLIGQQSFQQAADGICGIHGIQPRE